MSPKSIKMVRLLLRCTSHFAPTSTVAATLMGPQRRAPYGVVLLLSLTLSACAVGPTYVPPAVAVGAQWQAPLPHGGDVAALARWWADWNDAALTTLMSAAQANSPSLEQALARISQARASQDVAGSAARPSLSGTADASRGNSQSGVGVTTSFSSALQAAWELDLFGANRSAREAAAARFDARSLDWHQARVSLAAEVASTYVNLRIGQALLAGYERDAASRRETARLLDLKAGAGFEAPANAALARAGAAEARARYEAQRADVSLSVKALVALTDLTEAAVWEALRTSETKIPVSPPLAVERVPAIVLAQRPDVAAAERELAALAAEIGAAEADRYPRVSLSGSIGYNVGRALGATTDSASWGLGPSISIPVFDAGRRAANVALAKARYSESLAAYKGIATRAVREVEEALTQLHSARVRKPDLVASVSGYVQFERAAQARLSAGAGSVLELEDARRAVLAAQVGLLALEREQLIAAVALYRAVGGDFRSANSDR